MSIESVDAQWIAGSALFYPCCDRDLEVPLHLFASVVSDFYFVDVKMPRWPKELDSTLFTRLGRRSCVGGQSDDILHRPSNNKSRIHRWKRRGEDALKDISSLGVFFHRHDTLAQGEASSGVPWLGRSLFATVLSKLVAGGLVVTDGSNLTPDGPEGLAQFHNNRDVQEAAATAARPFEYESRRFTCIAYVGTRNGPTLVWRVS